MIYLDASAMVTHVTKRPNYAELRDFLNEHPGTPMATNTVGMVETVRNCDRMGSFPHLMAQLLRDYVELRITDEIRDSAANLPGGLATLDAIHVASAETLGDELVALITYDRRMSAIAKARGLPVVSPGKEVT